MAFEIVTWNCHIIVCGRVWIKFSTRVFFLYMLEFSFCIVRVFLGQQILEE